MERITSNSAGHVELEDLFSPKEDSPVVADIQERRALIMSAIISYAKERGENIAEDRIDAVLNYVEMLERSLCVDDVVAKEDRIDLLSCVLIDGSINEKELRKSLYNKIQSDTKMMNYCFGGLKAVEQYVRGRFEQYNRQIQVLEGLEYGPGDRSVLSVTG